MGTTLRTKPIQGNKLSLYLDFYPPITNPATGKLTRREFLDLFLYSEIEQKEEKYIKEGKEITRIIPVLDAKGQPKKVNLSPAEKKDQRKHNKETTELAENIKSQRILFIAANDYGFLKKDKNADFLKFFKDMANNMLEKSKTRNYNCVYNHFEKFTNSNCPINKLTPALCEEFKEYLSTVIVFPTTKKTKLSNTSTIVYYGLFITVLKEAVKKKFIALNPAEGLGGIKKKNNNKQREYLTKDELQMVYAAPCEIAVVKQAAIFSALTGLRFSDMQKLTWNEVCEENGVYSLRFITKKTSAAETLPISEQAYRLLGERQAANERVFQDLEYTTWHNRILSRWVYGAGVKKYITFHCFRHTYATLQLTLGTDLYTVSKMLGHSNISTTQVYARIIDEKKRTAADKVMIDL